MNAAWIAPCLSRVRVEAFANPAAQEEWRIRRRIWWENDTEDYIN
jgi:hypothetical protein